jgi:hypothetical protein
MEVAVIDEHVGHGDAELDLAILVAEKGLVGTLEVPHHLHLHLELACLLPVGSP